MTSSLSLVVPTAVALLLIFMIAWIFRLRKGTRTLDAGAIDANLQYVELLHKNDLLIAEIDRRDSLELELRGSEERYRTYVEHAPMGIFVANGGGEFAFVNPAMSLMTGFSKNELPTMTLAEVFSSDVSQESTLFFESVHQQNSGEKEITLRKKDGSILLSYIHAITLPGHSLIGFCMDITEKKRDEEQIYNLAFFDALTALPNRRRLLDKLRLATSNSVQEHDLGALLMMDLDHLKI